MDEFGDASRLEGIEPRFRIRLIRIKCRFSAPTSGGWADLLVNFVFLDDPSKHICELQVQHETLLRVRKESNAHEKYNVFRSAFEILETVGHLPTDSIDEQYQRPESLQKKLARLQAEVDELKAILERNKRSLQDMQATDGTRN
jgi:hypothetical protein